MKEFHGIKYYTEKEALQILGCTTTDILKSVHCYFFLSGTVKYNLLDYGDFIPKRHSLIAIINIYPKSISPYLRVLNRKMDFIEGFFYPKRIEYIPVNRLEENSLNYTHKEPNPSIIKGQIFIANSRCQFGNYSCIRHGETILFNDFWDYHELIELEKPLEFVGKEGEQQLIEHYEKFGINRNSRLSRQQQYKVRQSVIGDAFIDKNELKEIFTSSPFNNLGEKTNGQNQKIYKEYYSEHQLNKLSIDKGIKLNFNLLNENKQSEKNHYNNEIKEQSKVKSNVKEPKTRLKNLKILTYALTELLGRYPEYQKNGNLNVSKVADAVISFYSDNPDFKFDGKIPSKKIICNNHSSLKKEISDLIQESIKENENNFSQR